MGKEIVYCEGCGKSLREDEFARGQAHVVENRPYCTACRPLQKGLPTATPRMPSSAVLPRAGPPPSTRKTVAAAPAPPRRDSRTAIYVGGGMAAAALVLLVVVLASGGRSSSGRPQVPAAAATPPEAPRAAANRPEAEPEALQALERLASSSADPEAILAQCRTARLSAKGPRWEARIRKVEDRATELRMEREKKSALQLDPFLAQVRKLMQDDPGGLRKAEVEGMLEAARKIAGDRAAEVERMKADYLKRCVDAPRQAADEAQAEARALAAQKKFPEAIARLDRYPAEFRGTSHAAAVGKLRGEIDAAMKLESGLVRAVADGILVLGAERAALQGAKFALKGDKEKYLGNWSKAGDVATWTVENARPGKYRVELTYACAKDAGGELALGAGVSELKVAVQVTADFKTYKTVPLGSLILPGGRFALTARACSVNGGGLMNLRALRLVPEP